MEQNWMKLTENETNFNKIFLNWIKLIDITEQSTKLSKINKKNNEVWQNWQKYVKPASNSKFSK